MLNYLDKAITLAELVEGQTGLNPSVGAVIVKDGRIIGMGAHLKQGERHAEIQAIDMAGSKNVEGATMYVSLEPCSHFGKTPPCAKRIIETKIAHVVYAARDTTLPATGHQMMEEAGVRVDYRPHPRAMALYQDFFKSKQNEFPTVTIKVSASMDGKQATDDDESQWITNPSVKEEVFQLRHQHDAIITGTGTLHKDNPSLTVRKENGHHPTRVILAIKGKIQWDLQMFHDQESPIMIYTENKELQTSLPNVKIIYLEECHVETILKDLYQKGFGRVLVEAGPKVTSQFLSSNMITHFILYLAPKIIGGKGLNQFYQTEEILDLDHVHQFEIVETSLIDTNVKIHMKRK
ncbi:bifunctional diaminohydroxyphosphoribosylaminopyrimidine deaminase/5-amino-6-(5-phosphoribosylamino)uracil reductase RibD [Staphylococcus chromogenes]|uniref:bifunctional diaminohydroxyphosphoribosylaminopyrimidine deaminase/5-amino-6-(5-phosphoribosylamino)uracil reductase RibD n=1 Tax=Staphylococcus chromogenes TaxID=46126 RepID=UPI000D1BD7A0|nr:bifunctional diaminohydroxyphosphoribosylaminopyrimidine deaminase/5-amino-6-(5-phosphoribosylamino)uracil reductase RibD [Staphylococcus chromogenes]PTF67746.1 bifunctional diaminohydroxyphosphoribosylaminopyrimidine deaminase/5-amino-6-(5-phosphoribosylamino)uracil reductase RibD [Staphylococcus chromogenes]PTF67990.1 bifunctional diaminohydroxyphosphoribosylaminopyrimidine deaminase/5-amino-6-(5-phosphoribosylamino)uracil reductase RibD [Staphylococcus chromogenes]PTG07065.1 bifunctional d